MEAMQAKFEETIAKLREDLTARLRVQEAANKTMRYSWYGGQRRDDGMVSRGGGMPRQQQQLQQHRSRDGGMLRQPQQLQQHWSRDGGMPRQQQLQQHWSCDGGMPPPQQQQHWSRGGGMPRQQQQQHQWSRGGGIPHQHQRSSHAFPPAQQARQQQPLQQPSRGIPTTGGDGEDGSSPLSDIFFTHTHTGVYATRAAELKTHLRERDLCHPFLGSDLNQQGHAEEQSHTPERSARVHRACAVP